MQRHCFDFAQHDIFIFGGNIKTNYYNSFKASNTALPTPPADAGF
jgi:hypothetical protein